MFKIAVAADFSAVIPIIIMLINGRLKLDITQKLICSFAIIIFLKNALTYIMGELSIHNMYIYNWCNLIQGIILTIIYTILFKNSTFKLFAIFGITVSVIISLIDYQSLFDVATGNFNRFSYNTIGCLVIILTLLYFYQLIQYLQVPTLTKYSYFWFSTGALLYFAGTIFSYLFMEVTFNSTIQMRQQYWMIDAILAIIFNIFISFSIWYMKPGKTV
ncbi:hypothetical protein [Runella aurantiaca]|uniref:Uncharacterized protein n=1 Tax=Runella aurantiaca TaxID=2282308 RepID=A0A369I835_9BACT|nr:hypothetical protein [Runella aurantiaca]RDB05931.1 hypothetical protein DVG78_11020 [Runella aurantiaca]